MRKLDPVVREFEGDLKVGNNSTFRGRRWPRPGASPLVSVVVPAYNVDEHIRPCLESLESQTFRDIEIVVVDDGSTDRTESIISQVAEKSGSRFTVVTQANRGLSAARNAGLAAAKGDLITFVDGDDTVAPEYVAVLVAALRVADADLSACGLAAYRPGEPPDWPDMPKRSRRIGQPGALAEMLYGRAISTNAVGKLARRSLWESHPFPEGLLYEDLATIPGVIAACGTVAIVPEGLYGVTMRAGSITRNEAPAVKNVEDLERAVGICSSAVAVWDHSPLGAALRARRTLELCRLVHLAQSIDRVSQPVEAAVKRAKGEIRSNAKPVLLDRSALLSTKLRLLLTLGPSGVYSRAWELKKRGEGWFSD